MNAIDVDPKAPDEAQTRATLLPPYAQTHHWLRVTGWLTLATGTSALILASLWIWTESLPPIPLLAALRHTALVRVCLTSLLLAFTGSLATTIMAWARRRAVAAHRETVPRWRRAVSLLPPGNPALIGRTARWPQAIVVTALAALAIACAGLPPAAHVFAVPSAKGILLGAALLVFVFPLLIAERWLAAQPASQLPETAALRSLFLLPVLAWTASGLAQIAAALGIAFATRIDIVILVVLTAVAAELGLRALARCFLPPPPPETAHAAIDSALASMIAEGLRTRSLAEPIRQQLGLDFSRSWALAYLRAATPPILLLLLLVCWGLTGIVLINTDQRGVYERFGSPVAVLNPGAHLMLPWPLGQVRRVDYGIIHEAPLSQSDTGVTIRRVGAEDLAPAEADRLWEQAHPGELMFLIASGTADRQTFQVVSADIKLRYRIGLTDQDVLRAAYQVADPIALLHAAAGRVVATFFASQTLDTVLGENREEIADRLRAALRRELDTTGSGIDLTAVVVEAIHPPAGAAEAYHSVQAAEIRANTSIEAERGRAKSTQAKAEEYATEIVAQARAAAAETVGAARADLTRFTADRAAAMANGDAFLLERRLTAIAAGLANASLTISDHRIPASEAPVLDLRPLLPATARSTGSDQE